MLQSAGQGEKEKNGSHQGILVNWERIGGGVQMIIGRPPTLDTILPSYKPIDDAKDTRVSHISKQ